jgi:dihydrofolate reductase/diadenosine tetraphosphate (Ap4A) HIT family hydrolase
VISIVVARAANGAIGHRGQLPWRLPSDLRRFRALTLGHTVVMGRKTYESLPPQHRPLRERHNVVVSANPAFRPPDVEVHGTLQAALAAHGEDCFVIGGGSIYAQALEHSDRVYATEVDASPAGDAFFPELSPQEWRCVEEGEPLFEDDHRFAFCVYERNIHPTPPARWMLRERPRRHPPTPSPRMSAESDSLYHLPAARAEEQLRHMEKLEHDGVCVFCPEHFARFHREPVEIAGDHWYVTKNDYPYMGTRAHYLIVSNLHVRSFDELPDDAGAELWALKRELKQRLAPLATATVERSGDMRYNGGSVAHLHVHFVALDDAPAGTVRFKVSMEADGAGDAPNHEPTHAPHETAHAKETHGDHQRNLQL